MISIDGSYGEGGGQILRTAVSLSILTDNPVKITNIRSNRLNPGIKPQHYTALSLLKQLSNAATEGLEIGSSRLSFSPGRFVSGRYQFDVGTAGSLPLICQTTLPLALHITESLEIKLRGGTDVKWSPSWDYFTNVFLPLVQQCGIHVDTTLVNRGYYPKGGGDVVLRVHPSNGLQNILLGEPSEYHIVNGKVHLGMLPDHVGKRMKHQAIKQLLKENLQADISIDSRMTLSPGIGLTLWSRSDNGIIGCCILGEKGIPAETVAQNAVAELIKDVSLGASLDEHLFDQILMYLVLARGQSVCIVRSLSNHARTTMWLLEQFYPDKPLFFTAEYKGLVRVDIQGIG